MNAQNNVTLTPTDTQVSPPDFILPEGVIFNALTGQHEYHHLGEYIGEADTHKLANQFYHEFLRVNYDHVNRNPANVIPVNGNRHVTEIVADWYSCLDCGCCVDAGQTCQCYQPELTSDWLIIHRPGGTTRVSRNGGGIRYEEMAS